ncbi:MAG: thioesterase family protein [Spirochaetota bacterium]
MIHTVEIKVRGYHVDVFGHVNNARYLEFLEEARWDAIEESIDVRDIMQNGYAFNVVNININYRRPAVPNDVLVIESEIAKLNSRSGIVHQAVKLKGTETIVADADVTFVMFDVKNNKVAVLEGDLLALLQKV